MRLFAPRFGAPAALETEISDAPEGGL
jgi:hypothetical protein